MYEIEFTSHKHYLFGRLFSRNPKKAHTDLRTLDVVLLCPNQNDSQTFKSSRCKKNTSVLKEVCFLRYLHSNSAVQILYFINLRNLFYDEFLHSFIL